MLKYSIFILFAIVLCQLTYTDALKCSKSAKKTNKTTAIIRSLKMIKKSTPKYIHMPVTVSNCSEFLRLNHLTSCCPGRNDDCYMNYYGSRCYCDIFCIENSLSVNKHNDCCPDAIQTCQYNPGGLDLNVVTKIDLNGQISHKKINDQNEIKNEILLDKKTKIEMSNYKHGNFKNIQIGNQIFKTYSI